ncbi:Os01g0769532 [Oryza sativa Japonica Group]|uniref:Os01g0769532 protein n=1 Tax=Oryza sativa subsp. japonica TaxID=39947 RepID=A0A0P0V8M5_ORYSJ|nr:Os01g0769532 [Oryza sativa Japonica Group]
MRTAIASSPPTRVHTTTIVVVEDLKKSMCKQLHALSVQAADEARWPASMAVIHVKFGRQQRTGGPPPWPMGSSITR